MQAEIKIPARFNGPPTSGNGGYSCGMLAAFIDGPARVRLHVPPPLDTPLTVRESADGGVEMYAEETLIGSALPSDHFLEVPQAPSLELAEEAKKRYPVYEDHFFDTCFVCGTARVNGDGLELFTGPAKDWGLLATVWHPSADLLDESGNVRPEILWAALDCPGYFAAMGEDRRPAVLGQLEGTLYTTVSGAEPLIVYSWPLGSEGRKYYGGAAIATAAGDVIASSRSTWIELKA